MHPFSFLAYRLCRNSLMAVACRCLERGVSVWFALPAQAVQTTRALGPLSLSH